MTDQMEVPETLWDALPSGYERHPLFETWCAVAIAHAQSGTYERHGNEKIPQTVIQWLYDGQYVKTATDNTGEVYIYPTSRGEALLTAILGGRLDADEIR